MGRRKKIDKDYFIKKICDEHHDINYFIQDNETILWKGRPKKMAHILGRSLAMMPIGIIWGIIDITALAMVFTSGMELLEMIFVFAFFAVHLTPFWIWLYNVIKAARDSRETEYVVTDKRILVFKGGKGKYVSDYMDISTLINASLKINIIDRILCVGDITLFDDAGKEIKILDIPKAKFLHSRFLGLCNNPELKSQQFYSNKVECEYCDTMYDADDKKCPSCGSHNRG